MVEALAQPTEAPDLAQSSSTLRQRKPTSRDAKTVDSIGQATLEDDLTGDKEHSEDVTWGKTPSGVVFRVPQTHSFLHTMLNTLHRSSLTRWTFLSLLAQPVFFYLLRHHPTVRSTFFLLYFAFWRGTYDWGFAWALRRQSEERWIVKLLKRRGWLDVNSDQGGEKGREWAIWWKRELGMKMGEGYDWENVPPEFNAWLIFRQLVDLVLLK